jgi:hypothetical protein
MLKGGKVESGRQEPSSKPRVLGKAGRVPFYFVLGKFRSFSRFPSPKNNINILLRRATVSVAHRQPCSCSLLLYLTRPVCHDFQCTPLLQDPEIMREAQKMMSDPAFQAQMKNMTENPAFQQHMKQSQDVLKDPKKVKELESKMQDRLKEGTELLEKAKKEQATDGENENDKKPGSSDDDKKEEKDDDKKEDEDEMPDIPTLSLN